MFYRICGPVGQTPEHVALAKPFLGIPSQGRSTMKAFQRFWYVSHFPALAALCLMIALVQLGEPSELCGAAEEKALPSDLALVPSDGPIFITIRIGDLMSSKLG